MVYVSLQGFKKTIFRFTCSHNIHKNNHTNIQPQYAKPQPMKILCLVLWAITRTKGQLGTHITTTRRAPTCPKTIMGKEKPIMHMKNRFCQPSFSVFGGPNGQEDDLFMLRPSWQSCRPMSFESAQKHLAKNTLPINGKSDFPNRCPAAIFGPKRFILLPYASKLSVTRYIK